MRILKLKAILNLHRNRYIDINRVNTIIASPENLKMAQNIFESGITLLKNETSLIPLNKHEMGNLIGAPQHKFTNISCLNFYDSSFWDKEIIQSISNESMKRFHSPDLTTIPYEISSETQNNIFAKVEKSDLIIANLFIKVRPYKDSVSLSEKQIEIIKKSIPAGKTFHYNYIRQSLYSFGIC